MSANTRWAMCGKRCTMECSAKEPASAPRKGGGTANVGVYIHLSPIHPHHGPTWDASVWSRNCCGTVYPITRAHPNTAAPPPWVATDTHACKAPKQACPLFGCGEREAFVTDSLYYTRPLWYR